MPAPKPDTLTGTAVGNWAVIRPVVSTRHKRLWLCRCICGKERSVIGSNLRRGISRGCGCVNLKNRKRPYEALFNYTRAHSRGYEFSIAFEDFVEFTKIEECHYCGASVTWATHGITRRGEAHYNLDRKNNSIGYVKSNLVVCCGRCNRAKWNFFTYEQFLEIGKLIRKWEGRD